MVHKTKRRHYAQANTNNVNTKWALIQTTRRKDEPNIAENYVQYTYMIGKYNNYLYDHSKQVSLLLPFLTCFAVIINIFVPYIVCEKYEDTSCRKSKNIQYKYNNQ